MLWTKSLYFITFKDLDLAYNNLNYTFHNHSHDNDHLCFNPSINDDLMVQIHIFIFSSELWPLCVTLTLATGTCILNASLHLTMVYICAKFILKSLNACRSFAPDKCFSMTSKCDLDLWPRDLVHVRNTSSDSGEHFYEVSLKFLKACRRYALDKNWTRFWRHGENI
jgi:hypothetical protein